MSDTLKQLTYEQIHPSSNNLRLEFDQASLDQLEDSIVGIGILQALLVRKNEDGFEIIAGERRWRAVGQAIAKGRVPADFPIPSLVRTGIDDPTQTAAMVVENLHRAGLAPTEEYRGLLRLSNEYGWTVEQYAVATGIPKATVKARLSWAKLPADRLDELVATAGVTNVTELAALDATVQAKVLKAKGDKVVTTMRTAIDAKGREEKAKKLIASMRRKGHLVIRSLEDLTDAKYVDEKALFDKLAKKAKKDGGEVRTKHLWNADADDLDKLDVPTLFVVKVDQWNVNTEYFHIHMPFVPAGDRPNDTRELTDLEKAMAERRAAHDQAVEDWDAKLEAAKHELRREGKPAELIKLVLLDCITEIEDELAVDYDLVDEGDDVTVGDFARRNSTNLARAAVAWSLSNQWTLPPGFPEKPQYQAVDRSCYDGDGKFIPEDQRPAPEPEPVEDLSDVQHATNPDDSLPCIGCGGNPTPYLTTDGYAICDGLCLEQYEAELADDDPEPSEDFETAVEAHSEFLDEHIKIITVDTVVPGD